MTKKKQKSVAGAWGCADCETDAFDGQEVRPFVWAVRTSEDERRVFWDTGLFVEWLKEFDGVMYAHNGGKFDWLQRGVVEHLERGEIMLINSRLAKAKIGKCELRDSWLIIPSGLAATGDKLDFDYDILKRANKSERAKLKKLIEEYVVQDVDALFNLVSRFRERHGDALTQAGAALKTWEAMGGSKRRYGIYHDAFFREFYFGGRCEVFEYGAPHDGVFEYYDINSSYPAAMLQRHPLGTEYTSSVKWQDAPGYSFWTVRAISRGAFPLKDKNGLFFPNDDIEREFKISGWELRAAIETGTADIISGFGHIPKFTETLAPYVEKFYSDKEEAERVGDTVGRLIAKIFLNSLYGKYAANPENYKDYLIVDPGENSDGFALEIEGDGYDILSKPSDHAQYFDVALGASITGFARAALWRGICASEGVVYCDTDSILSRKFGGKKGNKLGEWKLEAVVDKLYIAGKKLYCARDLSVMEKLNNPENDAEKCAALITKLWKCAHKGFSKLNTTIFQIKQAARGEIVSISNIAPSIKITGAQTFITRRMRKTENNRENS